MPPGAVTGGGNCAGGLIGVIENVTDVTVRRCLASGNVISEQRQVGGLMAIAKMKSLTDAMNFILEKNIAWNASVTSHPTSATNWSSGGIIGVTNIGNTLTKNFRRPGMHFLDQGEWVLFDQSDVSPGALFRGMTLRRTSTRIMEWRLLQAPPFRR